MADKKTILTLNLGSQRIGMARFSLGGKGTVMLREYAFEEIPGDVGSDSARKAMTAAAVKSLAAKFKATGQDVNYSIPSQNTITRFVKVPSLGEDQVDKIVGFEAQQAVPFPLTETVWDYQIVGKAGGEVEVAIAAIRAELLEDINSSVADSGMNTKLVDAGPIALYNAFRYNFGEPVQSTLLLDIGSKMTDAIFMEGNRIFVASFPVAGSNITATIAKEMETDFETAEERKRADGFVHLGGNYADHDDPVIDAMSKIIRNQLTRVHSEINRRIQQYKTQGGSSPTSVYLAGAAAALPYMKEFLEEKLRLPVHWFNSLQNVSVGPKVDSAAVSREAHCLGELVGLALREMSCPMELDLSPRSVETARSISSKKPKLILATVALFAGLGALWTNLHFSKEAALANLEKVSATHDTLNGYASKIREEEKRQKKEEARGEHLQNAQTMRQYWLTMMNLINSKFKDDSVWVTQFQALNSEGLPISTSLTPEISPVPASFQKPNPQPTPQVAGKPKVETIDAIHISGLYSRNAYDRIKEIFLEFKDKSGGTFAIPDNWEQKTNNWYILDTGRDTQEWASTYQMRLPLTNKLKVTLPSDGK